MSQKTGNDLFIVDNGDDDWRVWALMRALTRSGLVQVQGRSESARCLGPTGGR